MADRPDHKMALVAAHRFGLGLRGGSSGDLFSAASDPRGFVKAELVRPQVAMLVGPGLASSRENLQILFRLQTEVRKARELKPPERNPNLSGSDPQVDARFIQETFRAETLARQQRQFSAGVGFVERLVSFWSNHFCVSVAKDGFVRVLAGAYEREAIRPHIFGRFSDLLQAVEQHPAMLHYLDNQQSIGPNSRAGRNQNAGINENFAREILELHTLGVGGGYHQADVTELARVLTGWTVVGPPGQLGEPGTFVFNPFAHEPGARTVLQSSYREGGVEQGEAVLHALARHPSTAKFIALKLARHFVADDPPRSLVEKLAKIFLDTEGDLKAVYFAILDSDEAWSAPLTKVRAPQEFLIAATRLIGRMPEFPGQINGGSALLGQPMWEPPGPNGFSDVSATWAGPEGMKVRLDISSEWARRLGDATHPKDLLEMALGDAVSGETHAAVLQAESKQQALTLLLMSPEFQRR